MGSNGEAAAGGDGLNVWRNVDADGHARVYRYSFGPAFANMLAVRGDDGWLVISPACGVAEAAFADLERDAKVASLVAPNAYHHLGQKPWRARFPDARSYAAPGSIPRLSSQKEGVDYLPISDLKLPGNLKLWEPPHTKPSTDLLLRADLPGGPVWYSGDVLSNTKAGEGPWYFRAVSALLGGGPGLRVSGIGAMLYVKDKAAYRQWLRERLSEAAPVAVVPGHGHVFSDPKRTEAVARIFGS